MSQTNVSLVVEIPKTVSVFEDAKSKARTVAFPIDYPDGSHGVIILTRLKDEVWVPSKSIESIVINYV